MPDELDHGGQNNDQAKSPISEAEAKEFWRTTHPKNYLIVKY